VRGKVDETKGMNNL